MDSDFSAPPRGAFAAIPDIIARMKHSITAKTARVMGILEGI
jgi:hypothetical protein